ncbi:hypothetical protein [Arthrobacter sp. 162MFSha1.1]|uniref:hypothetical protein n=1 Tax=Arthrobacter sp. 162MFSha1.1 TaxID=1151119 RepID=UPI00036D2BB5|nr:hypothetical protein [Arthrobacter sp. 162MFSha1.1]
MSETAQRAKSVERVAYSLQETAEATGKTFSAVYQQMMVGKIPTCRVGRRHLVPASYFEEHAITPARKGA